VNTFFYSDPHFFHEAVIGFCNRPFSGVAEMNESLLKRYNTIVGDDDFVYWLGDISFGRFSETKEIFQWLKGQRVLVQGNHDKFSMTQYRQLGFSAVIQEAKIRLNGNYYQLSHYPYAPTAEEMQSEPNVKFDVRYLDARPIDKGSWLLHGHVHSAWKHRKRMINCGVDVWEYAPVHITRIEKIVAKGTV